MNNNRSTFVTVIAWLFIVGSGFGTLISVMQNIMFHFMFKKDVFSQLPDDIPAATSFMFENFHLVLLSILLVSLFMFVSSIGLLRRKNWARLVFIVILTLGIVWMVGGIVFQVIFFSSMPEVPHEPEFDDFQTMHSIMMWFTAVIGVGIAGLLAWIIKRLLSDSVRQEFKA